MSAKLFKNCLKELLKDRKFEEINIEPIYQYLESFKSFISLLKNQTSSSLDNLLTEISKQIELRKIYKNELIFQQGEIAENFYIILKGNLKVFKLIPCEYYMTNEEYISYLLDLRMHNQTEIIRQSKHYNNLVYPISEHFDFFVKNLSSKEAGALYVDMHNLMEKAEEVYKHINQEQDNNTEKMIKYSPEEYIQKFKVSNDIINNTEIINNFINEKIDMNNVKEINEIKLLMKDRKKVTIPCYVEFIQLGTGYTFEDQAFENHGSQYQSSFISLEDGYLGFFNKKKYSILLHESIEKRNKKLFSLLVYFSFMKLNNQFIFEKKYLHFFNDKVFNVHYELFKEGEECENTFFITEGEYELSMTKNIIEVNEMIIEYKKILKRLNPANKTDKQIFDYEEETRQNNDLILNKKFRSEEVNELIMKKKYIKINIIHKKEILGLSDVYSFDRNEVYSKKDLLIYKELKKKCLLTCKCINSHCHAFYIPNSIFNYIYYNEGNYNIISKNLEFKKICTIIERLKIYKKSVFDLVKKSQNKFAKGIKILKEISKIPKFKRRDFNKPKIYSKIIKELKELKESIDKFSEKSQKPMHTLKHSFKLKIFEGNYEDKDNLFPSIIKEQKSKRNVGIKLQKRNTNKILNNSNNYNSNTYSSDFNNLFIHNILYENLFYNYTINNNSRLKKDYNDSFSTTFKSTKPIIKNERYQNYADDVYINNKMIYTNYKMNSMRNYNGINRVNLSVNEKLMNRKKNLIGCYDPLAFDKFNNLFSFHFKRQMNDSSINKTNKDK